MEQDPSGTRVAVRGVMEGRKRASICVYPHQGHSAGNACSSCQFSMRLWGAQLSTDIESYKIFLKQLGQDGA